MTNDNMKKIIVGIIVISLVVMIGCIDNKVEPTPEPSPVMFEEAVIRIAVYSDISLVISDTEFVNFPIDEFPEDYIYCSSGRFRCKHEISDLYFCSAEIKFTKKMTEEELYKWFSDNNITTIRFCPYQIDSCIDVPLKLVRRNTPLFYLEGERCEVLQSDRYMHFTTKGVFSYLDFIEK